MIQFSAISPSPSVDDMRMHTPHTHTHTHTDTHTTNTPHYTRTTHSQHTTHTHTHTHTHTPHTHATHTTPHTHTHTPHTPHTHTHRHTHTHATHPRHTPTPHTHTHTVMGRGSGGSAGISCPWIWMMKLWKMANKWIFRLHITTSVQLPSRSLFPSISQVEQKTSGQPHPSLLQAGGVVAMCECAFVCICPYTCECACLPVTLCVFGLCEYILYCFLTYKLFHCSWWTPVFDVNWQSVISWYNEPIIVFFMCLFVCLFYFETICIGPEWFLFYRFIKVNLNYVYIIIDILIIKHLISHI